jgi:DNA mismatch repair protein MutS
MVLEQCAPDRLGAALARLGPSEVVVRREGWAAQLREAIESPRAILTATAGEARLKAVHISPRSTALASSAGPMLAAAGGLIAYLDHVGRAMPLLLPPVARRRAHLAMDEATRASLEILVSQPGRRRAA